MKQLSILPAILSLGLFCCCNSENASIPLPEHPRPDFERQAFLNLNGTWSFTFDDAAARASMEDDNLLSFDKEIQVPFPWGSKLSGVEDEGNIAWYGRSVMIPKSWKDKRVFLVIGASDWETSVWFDDDSVGVHRGGYTPFEFELTNDVEFGEWQNIYVRVDDTSSSAHLYGKQGYGNARGIWQTVYLEARGSNYIDMLHFTPDIDSSRVKVDVELEEEAVGGMSFELRFPGRERKTAKVKLEPGQRSLSFNLDIPDQHLWTLDDPYLYNVEAVIKQSGKSIDKVRSYFGQRKISAETVPGQDYKYVALNGEPIYLQLCLDQSYHPDGFYTFPSDEFMKNEIMISKNLGLNGNRIHIKTELPRKLYWADKLGLLIMADIPNFWGEPVPEARQDWENCMREQIRRDYNHPSIFAWVDFNETWGLFTKVDGKKEYLPETQEWVRSMYKLTKSLDPTRLVEDNSPCNHDHVQTDINSWHSYRAGHTWERFAAMYDELTVVGSEFNYIGGNTYDGVPMINSECGNVWGYNGSAGNCDYSWDYHEMMNAFHRHLHIGGWLYTEHHDVINEWNGYVKYDRSRKIDGLSDFVPGMEIKDFHSPYYVVTEGPVCEEAYASDTVTVKILSSFTTVENPGKLTLECSMAGTDGLGRSIPTSDIAAYDVDFRPFNLSEIASVVLTMPAENGLYVLRMVLKDASGSVLHRNFKLFRVRNAADVENTITFSPASFTASSWSLKQTSVMDGLKVNGFGYGYFEYEIALPEYASSSSGAELIFEAGAKQLFGKDVPGSEIEGDYMLGKGTFDPCKSPNSYAMTDDVLWPSELEVFVDGDRIALVPLEDDPADSRGALSWFAQPHERYMFEGGSYGKLISVDIPAELLRGDSIVIRIGVPECAVSDTSGGLALYGKDFGRYPMNPTIVFKQ